MPISDKTRKILWAKSGSKCAICRTEIVMNSSTLVKSVVGDECHIISKQEQGPRYNPSLNIDFDDYENLILLCKVHHKLIDDTPHDYTVEKLKKIKQKHEEWVENIFKNGAIRLKELTEEKEKVDEYLPKIFSGRELVPIVERAHLYDFSYCELEDQKEVELISTFGEDLQNYGDLIDEFGFGKRVEIEFELTNELKELEAAGFFVFGSRMRRKMKVYGALGMWDVAVIRIFRKEDPSIIKIDLTTK